MANIGPGFLFFYFVCAVLLTIPVSFILIWRYRSAINETMKTGVGDGAPPSFDGSPSDAASTPRPGEPERAERLLRVRAAVVYAAAGAAAAVIWTVVQLHSAGFRLEAVHGFAVFYAFCWPVVPTFVTLLSLERRQSVYLCAAYLLAGLLIVMALTGVTRLTSGNPEVSMVQSARMFLALVALDALAPALIIWIVSRRRIRGVSPLVLAGLLAFVFSSVLATAMALSWAETLLLQNPDPPIYYLYLGFMIVACPK